MSKAEDFTHEELTMLLVAGREHLVNSFSKLKILDGSYQYDLKCCGELITAMTKTHKQVMQLVNLK